VLAELQRVFASELWGDGARLRIHRETTLGALADALETTYSACARLVGADFFRALARRFAREVPSRSPDLNDYGAEFAEYLAGFEPARELPYLPDVARLEWALHRARHASAPVESLEPKALTPDSRLALTPGTALLSSPYPVDRIWNDEAVSLAEGGVELVIAREGVTRVTPAELALLAALARGETLAEAAHAWPEAAESLGALLARAVTRRWLA